MVIKQNKMKKGIYKFFHDGDKYNFLGTFTMEVDYVKYIKENKINLVFSFEGQDVDELFLNINDFKLISDLQKDVEWFEKLDLSTGHNPFFFLYNGRFLVTFIQEQLKK